MINPIDIRNMEMVAKQRNKRLKWIILLFSVMFLFGAYKCAAQNQSHLEKLSAKKFHDLINQHRIKNGRKPLAMNNSLCNAAYKHNKWMSSNNKCQHDEIKGTKDFIAVSVSRRIDSAGFHEFWRSGENCYFDSEEYGKIYLNADTIAKRAFIAWKESKGHNENMLYDYDYHGIAFYIRKDVVWGTSVFCKSIHLVSK